ncbi:MAG TPA: YggS family pyridoxal phosphate-dependent enzyme [Saprospiraceae bacterium]|nr:YggS family pyridoxal phosphate-dependent enzyme [Saprospiraceae bacterium]
MNYLDLKSACDSHDALVVTVSKMQEIEKVMKIYHQGCRDFAENRVHELIKKAKQMPMDVRWHLIGQLQRNKVKEILPYVHLIHSVDRFSLLEEIHKHAVEMGKKVSVLLELKLAQEDTKSGFLVDELYKSLKEDNWSKMTHVKVIGIMAMASNTTDQAIIRNEFKLAKSIFEQLKLNFFAGAEFNQLSMGMSSDYLIALEEGSTIVRVGSLLFTE